MKYRLDEPIYRGKALKRFIWIEPYYPVPNDPNGFTRHYTEKYIRIDLTKILRKNNNV